MAEFDAIVLAAGTSSRMGSKNKLLLDWRGAPLVAHTVRTYLEAADGPVTVVTGFEADLVRAALGDLPVTICHNAVYETGQQSSVIAGLGQPSSAGATLLGLADQPLFSADDLRWLMAAHKDKDPDKITVPVQNAARGNPIVIPSGLRTRMLENPKAPGCRRFTRDHPALVTMMMSASPGFFTDIDTPDDYAERLAQAGGCHEAAS